MNYKKVVALVLCLAVLCGSLTGCQLIGKMAGKGEVVYFYNYGDYMDPDLLARFEKETGIKVVMDCFDTNESMYPVVAGGQVQYDVVVSDVYMAEKMMANDLIVPLDFENIPNASNLEEEYMSILAKSDPGNKYLIPYNWGTVGIMYNKTMIEEGSIKGWKDLWNPAYKEKGILMMDSLRDTFMVAEMILGYSMNTKDKTELQKVVDLLIEQEPIVSGYETDAARDTLITESAAIGVIYSGEYLYCTGENEDLEYVVPEEGTNVWFDCFVVPKNAKNKSGAEKFINFMLDAEVGLATFDYLGYPTPNKATKKLIDEEYLQNPAIFPNEEQLAHCDMYHYLGEEYDQILSDYWKQFRGN